MRKTPSAAPTLGRHRSNPLLRGLPPTHPGAILRRDVVPALGKSVRALAALIGVTPPALNNVLNEKAAVTTEMALRLGKLCGNGPEVWLNLQREFDLVHARAELEDELGQIPTLVAADADAQAARSEDKPRGRQLMRR